MRLVGRLHDSLPSSPVAASISPEHRANFAAASSRLTSSKAHQISPLYAGGTASRVRRLLPAASPRASPLTVFCGLGAQTIACEWLAAEEAARDAHSRCLIGNVAFATVQRLRVVCSRVAKRRQLRVCDQFAAVAIGDFAQFGEPLQAAAWSKAAALPPQLRQVVFARAHADANRRPSGAFLHCRISRNRRRRRYK